MRPMVWKPARLNSNKKRSGSAIWLSSENSTISHCSRVPVILMRSAFAVLFGLVMPVLYIAPVSAQSARLCLSGSNTVGQKLAPALVKAWVKQQGWTLASETTPALDEARLTVQTSKGLLFVDVLAHGTSTGFAALRDRQCDLWMASRQVKRDEIDAASALGPLFEHGQEHVIALDGLAVIVHPANPIAALTVDQVRDVFAGRVRDWSQLDGAPGVIALHARDDRSGTFDTFKSLVLADASLAAHSSRYESTEQLSSAVSADVNAIGFVGLGGVGRAKALALSERGTRPMGPTALSVATEDYVLSRRLFLYSASTIRAEAQAFLDFAVGLSGQQVVRNIGFVPQDVVALSVARPPEKAYADLVEGARRVSLNFRFGEGAAVLDNKAVEDIERLSRFMQQPGMQAHDILLIGFADRSEAIPYLALSLSNDRVDLVASELRSQGLRVSRQRGLGQIAPVASNDSAQGRLRNRRVEVWVRPASSAVQAQQGLVSGAPRAP